MQISYLGPAWSFSHICYQRVSELLPCEAEGVAFDNFWGVINAMHSGQVDMALIPIENSLGGNVSEVLDLITRVFTDIHISLEYVLQISHQLVGYGSISDITEIRAHDQAIMQSYDYLKKNHSKVALKRYASNSGAASSLSADTPDIAGICSRECAEYLDIPILQSDINDSAENYTRFWLISRKPMPVSLPHTSQCLTSFAFRIPLDRPGGLVDILNPLAQHNINMTKILSIPTKGMLCEYTFVIDIASKTEAYDIKSLADMCSEWRIWGEYPVYPEFDNRFH